MQDKARFIQPVIVALIMTFIVTFAITLVNLGWPPDFLKRWMIAWAFAWPVATVAAFIAIPVAKRATAWLLGGPDKPRAPDKS